MNKQRSLLPDSLAELRRLLDEIERGDGEIRLGKRSRRVMMALMPPH